ncbi:MAG: YbaB/EbfC family nucleoid-associated protein [Spirochaetaceae bacterium]|nr:YbaB/EbfC family nucleoid-associated protein [Spirochaetaceae bacterium]
MQGQMEEMQEKLKDITAQGSSGGDLVKITMNGRFEVLDLSLDPIAVDPRDVKMLEELILSAYSGALEKIQLKFKEEMGGMIPGMPGLQL